MKLLWQIYENIAKGERSGRVGIRSFTRDYPEGASESIPAPFQTRNHCVRSDTGRAFSPDSTDNI